MRVAMRVEDVAVTATARDVVSGVGAVLTRRAGGSMPRMRQTWPAVLASILVSAAVSGQPGTDGSLNPPRSPRNADYTITARLDPATRTITGTEVITWRNVTTKPAADLQFHLYWNAWKNPRSTFMREQIGRASCRERV